MRDTLAADPHQTSLSASADTSSVAKGHPVTVTASFTNHNGFAPAADVALSAKAPMDMTVKPVGETTAVSVAPGKTFRATFEIRPVGDDEAPDTQVLFSAVYKTGGCPGSAIASVHLREVH